MFFMIFKKRVLCLFFLLGFWLKYDKYDILIIVQ